MPNTQGRRAVGDLGNGEAQQGVWLSLSDALKTIRWMAQVERGMAMAKPVLYFFTPELAHVSGGVKQIYRHVDILNAVGFDAAVVHKEVGFVPKWFEHHTRVKYTSDLSFRDDDVGVFPEIWGPLLNNWRQPRTKVILNQNAYYTFIGHPLHGNASSPYLNPQVVASIVVSEDSRRYLQYVFPKVPVHRIFYSINPRLYFPQEKKKQLCVMPRKNPEDVKQVLEILRCRGALEGWSVVLIHKMTEMKAAEVMRESAVFLSFGSPEGFGLPPAEALTCHCLVAGYTGGGGSEFLNSRTGWPVAVHDAIGFAKVAEEILRRYCHNPGSFSEMIQAASALIRENYSEARQRQSIVDAWQNILKQQITT